MGSDLLSTIVAYQYASSERISAGATKLYTQAVLRLN